MRAAGSRQDIGSRRVFRFLFHQGELLRPRSSCSSRCAASSPLRIGLADECSLESTSGTAGNWALPAASATRLAPRECRPSYPARSRKTQIAQHALVRCDLAHFGQHDACRGHRLSITGNTVLEGCKQRIRRTSASPARHQQAPQYQPLENRNNKKNCLTQQPSPP